VEVGERENQGKRESGLTSQLSILLPMCGGKGKNGSRKRKTRQGVMKERTAWNGVEGMVLKEVGGPRRKYRSRASLKYFHFGKRNHGDSRAPKRKVEYGFFFVCQRKCFHGAPERSEKRENCNGVERGGGQKAHN